MRTLLSGPLLRIAVNGLAFAVVTVSSGISMAQETIRDPGRHPVYPVEVEPHALVAFDNLYGNTGIGAGLRLSIPIVQDGFVKSIDDSVAIGFGVDWLHYSGCYFNGECSANYLMFPVATQWNFFFTRPRSRNGSTSGAKTAGRSRCSSYRAVRAREGV
jgi:hypothetical protein